MPPKGSRFILEHLKERATASTPEEMNLAFKAVDFIGVFLNQLDNWLLNYLEVQMFGAGEKFFLSLAAGGRLEMKFEVVEGAVPYVTVSSRAKGGSFLEMYGMKDYAGAKYAGRQTMGYIGERKSFNK